MNVLRKACKNDNRFNVVKYQENVKDPEKPVLGEEEVGREVPRETAPAVRLWERKGRRGAVCPGSMQRIGAMRSYGMPGKEEVQNGRLGGDISPCTLAGSWEKD